MPSKIYKNEPSTLPFVYCNYGDGFAYHKSSNIGATLIEAPFEACTIFFKAFLKEVNYFGK